MVIAHWQHVPFLTWEAKEGRDSLAGTAYTVPVSSTPDGEAPRRQLPGRNN